jgi:hypothetical protein
LKAHHPAFLADFFDFELILRQDGELERQPHSRRAKAQVEGRGDTMKKPFYQHGVPARQRRACPGTRLFS